MSASFQTSYFSLKLRARRRKLMKTNSLRLDCVFVVFAFGFVTQGSNGAYSGISNGFKRPINPPVYLTRRSKPSRSSGGVSVPPPALEPDVCFHASLHIRMPRHVRPTMHHCERDAPQRYWHRCWHIRAKTSAQGKQEQINGDTKIPSEARVCFQHITCVCL